MTKRAIVDLNEKRIVSIFDRGDHLVDLPWFAEAAEIGKNQILGPAEIRIFGDRVVEYQPAIRALSGVVAILDDKGNIVSTRDLGPTPVGVKSNVFPYIEERAEYNPETEVLEGPEVIISDDEVRRVWVGRKKTKNELAAEAEAKAEAETAAKEGQLSEAFGSLGIQAVFDQENRLRKLEGVEPINLEDFKAGEVAKL